MKKTSLSKFMALAMTGVMLCAPLSVSAAPTTEITDKDAATGGVTGDGNVEAIVDKSIFKVELPTEAEEPAQSIFKFTLDPQGLIMETEAAAHGNAAFDGTGFYFTNKTTDEEGNEVTSYSCSSDSLTATNKGTVPVDVQLDAAATLTNISLSEDDTFESDPTAASVYLALISGDFYEPLKADTATATINTSLDPAVEGAYAVKYDSTAGYTYELTQEAIDNPADYFPSLQFSFYGLCNTAGDFASWDAAKDDTPQVSVTWTLTEHVETPAP
ncbi:MAG: hypothetical protein HFJ06_11375 [Lachnospiraceae bacterium]|nr:hypothetical protein [Lachnospiraceae bacterium]